MVFQVYQSLQCTWGSNIKSIKLVTEKAKFTTDYDEATEADKEKASELAETVKQLKSEIRRLQTTVKALENTRAACGNKSRRVEKDKLSSSANDYQNLKQARTSCNQAYIQLLDLQHQLSSTQQELYILNKRICHQPIPITQSKANGNINKDTIKDALIKKKLVSGNDPGLLLLLPLPLLWITETGRYEYICSIAKLKRG